VRQYEKPVEINHDRIVCAHFDCVWKNGWLGSCYRYSSWFWNRDLKYILTFEFIEYIFL